MFRKLHSVFHPNSSSRNLSDGNACYDGSNPAVRLVRSTSMYVVGERNQKFTESLKKYKSTTNIESSGCYPYKEEDQAWMFSKTQDCLQYLQDLLALRKKYLTSLHNLKSLNTSTPVSPLSTSSRGRNKPPPIVSANGSSLVCNIPKDRKNTIPQAEILDAIAYFDSVIADLDERRIKVSVTDHINADVDFDVATSSSEHSLHSNWILRAPRRSPAEASLPENHCRRNNEGTWSCKKRIERHPVYLPKAVEGAFNTLKFQPKLCKKGELKCK
ncbi:uncharacterized protein C13orf42 homolog [Pleurodeles waltl]|uniref:uncharacterized protein C13orf42 homolog n=1 Tax=Pleurodeles waltl TaxID=8319 RepID=UPI003709674D